MTTLPFCSILAEFSKLIRKVQCPVSTNDVCEFQQVGYFVAGMEAMVYSDIVCTKASINRFISLYLCIEWCVKLSALE